MIRLNFIWTIIFFTQFVLMGDFFAVVQKPSGSLPRTVLALYDGLLDEKLQWSRIHQFAEMPLNHLGVKLRYHNIREGFPELDSMSDLIGVISWYNSGTQFDHPLKYLKWAESVVRSGKKLVILGEPGFRADKNGKPVSQVYINRFFRLLGIKYIDEWIRFTYDLEFVYKNSRMVEFERKYKGFNPPFFRLIPLSRKVKSHLIVQKAGQPNTESHVVMTFPAGGYVADGYAIYTKTANKSDIRQWLINPFEFFQQAFILGEYPKPDTTTLAGRRIYYSHIDGDGWLNRTLIEEYQSQRLLSSQVVMKEIIKAYPNLPVTVTSVVAEIDPKWYGSKESLKVAKELFSIPQVEMGSHTYSHPFDWEFFADGNAQKEASYLYKYPNGGWGGDKLKNRFLSLISRKEKKDYSSHETGVENKKYPIPRAYARHPFDLDLEIKGAAEFLNGLAPIGKTVKVLMWTGNTTPFEEAIKKTRLAGFYNINGGDSRFDREFRSYAWVSSIGRIVGDEIQIYSSNSNENTYTDLWKGRFHGFRYLVYTLDNTDSPIRIKPFNLYYHMYSGERRASMNAIISNLKHALSKEIIPIATSHYCAIAEGFYSTRIFKTGFRRWRIEKRGHLQTIRFDKAAHMTVDFNQSKGIIGQRYFQNSLYCYLDASIENPELVLRKSHQQSVGLKNFKPFLIQSRWRIWNLSVDQSNFSFQTEGFGTPEMTWQVPWIGTYGLTYNDSQRGIQNIEIIVSKNRLFKFNPQTFKNSSTTIDIRYKGN